MKRAIISDIHGNLEALEAVLADIQSQGITTIYCLGDIVGYGPNPRECLDIALNFTAGVLGNHDSGALFDPEGFSSGAEKAIFWTRHELEKPVGDREQQIKRWDFLLNLPRMLQEGDLLFVHGSARNPLNEYVFPEDIYNPRKLKRIFGIIKHTSFQGHTHVPGVFTESNRFLSPDDLGFRFKIGSEKVMVNVGSVGQPRDGDVRACYVVLEDNVVTYRRVEYPLETTIQKIHAIPELDNFLGDRLREGR